MQQSQRVVDEVARLRSSKRRRSRWRNSSSSARATSVQRGNSTQELLDQRRQQLERRHRRAATPPRPAIAQAEHALVAATSIEIELLKINIADNTLVAPRDGRIQYRIANVGEVLPAGGKVFTMIDIIVGLHGHLPADPGCGTGQDRHRCAHRARCLSEHRDSRPRCRSSQPSRSSRPRRSRPRPSATG